MRIASRAGAWRRIGSMKSAKTSSTSTRRMTATATMTVISRNQPPTLGNVVDAIDALVNHDKDYTNLVPVAVGHVTAIYVIFYVYNPLYLNIPDIVAWVQVLSPLIIIIENTPVYLHRCSTAYRYWCIFVSIVLERQYL
jgi:hypothetical protein